MTTRAALMLTILAMAVAAFGGGTVQDPYERVAPSSVMEPTPGEMLAFALTLFGFLGLIATNLVRWSSDLSWKERSVFPRSQEGSRRSSRSPAS